jgi:hypothetical protein
VSCFPLPIRIMLYPRRWLTRDTCTVLIVMAKANMSELADYKSGNAGPGWSAVGGQTINVYVSRLCCLVFSTRKLIGNIDISTNVGGPRFSGHQLERERSSGSCRILPGFDWDRNRLVSSFSPPHACLTLILYALQTARSPSPAFNPACTDSNPPWVCSVVQAWYRSRLTLILQGRWRKTSRVWLSSWTS